MIEVLEYMIVYMEELDEQLQLMEKEILRLEMNGESDEGIQSLFRAAHTLKGSSAAMGLDPIKDLTHEMEHLLDKVRSKQLRMTNEMVNLLFKCLDHLKLLKEEVADNKNTPIDITSLIMELHHLTSESASKKPDKNVFSLTVHISPSCEMKAVRSAIIQKELNSWGNVLLTSPALEDLDHAFEEVNIVFEVDADAAEVKSFVVSLMDVEEADVAVYQPMNQQVNEENPKASSGRIEAETEGFREKQKSQTIRVNVERLEHLMNLVGELVIDQTRIQQVDKHLSHKYVTDDSVEELGQISDHISRVIGNLQESVMKLRMLPIEHLFNRFPRMVRDLSQSLHKEVDLIIEGSETELDRTLIDEIGDPLIHLIRNAIDHGIEAPEERIRKGKEAKGQLRMKAAHEDNQVVVIVEDDGAGIDPQQIKDSAVRKGMIGKEKADAMTDQEAIRLIFQPGFSTASSISEVSGRGVGMDIVQNHIQMLNGLIDIETESGKGTRFKIKLPLTLAIITGLLVKLSDKTFIIPMSHVAEIIRITPEELQTIHGEPVIVIRNQVIPLIWLQQYFHIPQTRRERGYIPLVIVSSGDKRVALAVDELNGNQEVVIKSLDSYVGKIDCISGATILGDGRVALILDVSGVANMTR